MIKMKMMSTCCALLFILFATQAQKLNPADTVKVNDWLEKSKELMGKSPDQALELSMRAKDLAEHLKFAKGEALALKMIGNAYNMRGNYIDAMQYWKQSMDRYQQMKDLSGVSNILNNIGTFYSIQGDFEKALENYLLSLKYAEQTGNQERIASALINIGATFSQKPETYDKALSYYLKALPITEKIRNLNALAITAVNIGEVYANKGDSKEALAFFQKSLQVYKEANDEAGIPYAYNSIANEYRKQKDINRAIHFHKLALTTAQSANNKLYIVQSLIGLANTYTEKGNLPAALTSFDRAEALAREINALNELKDIYRGLSLLYSKKHRFDKAFTYQALFMNTKDSLYNLATDKRLVRMEFDYNLQKKQGEINMLTKDRALKDMELKEQRLKNNTFMAGAGLLLIIALVLYRNYAIKAKTNQLLDKKNEQIESLLLNILPDEVAKELQETGTATPRNYSHVSVLFTDFKGFSFFAQNTSPQELIKELNDCFMEFDNIIEKYNLEKIKTIGDAYMCAGGIPTPDDDHPFRMVKAAIEIRDYISRHNQKRVGNGLAPWPIRIGIHVGPLVAGIVGKKKYAYDIWGSTVNIASRMESNGVPGKINISSALYQLVRERYVCSPRGRIHAKNVGDIDMYFLEQEKTAPISAQKEEILLS